MIGYWKGRKYQLDKMSLRELIKAFALYPAIEVYALIGVASAALAASWAQGPVGWAQVAIAAAAAWVLYPIVWYALHRFVLHGRYLYRSPLTARVWRRIHFDHHRDPHDLRVLFGALYTTLPTIALVVMPVGWLIGGPAGIAGAMAAAMAAVGFYEFCHCVQHLAYAPKSRFLKRIKKLHLAHHFHNEQGNYGITNFLPDRLMGTLYTEPKARPRSATVFNLGYAGEETRRYPWVAASLETPLRAGETPRRKASVSR